MHVREEFQNGVVVDGIFCSPYCAGNFLKQEFLSIYDKEQKAMVDNKVHPSALNVRDFSFYIAGKGQLSSLIRSIPSVLVTRKEE